jgi:hypothetical protein
MESVMFKGEKRAPADDAKAKSKSGDAGRPISGNGSASNAPKYEIILFTKTNGPLTKRISLTDDGSVFSDGSACIMSRGTALPDQQRRSPRDSD